MRIVKEIIERTIIENGEETKSKRVLEHTIKTWEELTRQEKEIQIAANQDGIYEEYQEQMYTIFKDELGNLKEDFPHIKFEDVYMDSNSQGWWIDRIKDFNYCIDNITVYNETLWVDFVDFRIRKLIEDFEIETDGYYISGDKWNKIIATNKYKNWVKKIEEDIQNWVDRVNTICNNLGNAEYHCPYNLDNESDRWFLDEYFSDMEFTDTKTLSGVE